MLVPALVLAISTPAAAQEQVPASFRSLKPHQIIEAVIAERGTLDFTEIQARQLDSVHLAVREEVHRYERARSNKAHQNVRMKPMISKRQAYANAMAILTPEQRVRATARFGDAAYRLPTELQATAPRPEKQAAEPLDHHVKAGAPTAEATDSAKLGDPLDHRGGETPPAREGDSGKSTNPVTHQ
jgi:hypothetical protein